jgi:UDP-N-acetyl-2-amino-2-deoxyglucuronate dehydrogenase
VTGFALVGCGRIAPKHADLLHSGEIKGAKLIAVCDIKPERAKAFGERYSVPYFIAFEEMMAALGQQIDVISVLTESGNHAKDVIAASKHGKHIVVEKPMALSVSDADDMVHACDTAGVKLFVVKQNRYNVPVQIARKAFLCVCVGAEHKATTTKTPGVAHGPWTVAYLPTKPATTSIC